MRRSQLRRTLTRNVRRARRGFTLIEVITAIALTAIVTAIASAAIASAGDARATTLRHQVTLDAESRFRVLLTDMLRHAPAADAVDEPLLRISAVSDITGAHRGMRLVFLSQGVEQPFGTGRTWRVTLQPGADGVELIAEAIGRGEARMPLRATLPHRHALVIAVLEQASDAPTSWRDDWPVERTRPALIRIALTDAGDSDSSTPIIVELSPLSLVNRVATP